MQYLKFQKRIKTLIQPILSVMVCFSAYSQEPWCADPVDETLLPKSTNCNGPATLDSINYIGNKFYVPDVTVNNTPIKTVKVNINVFQDNGGYNQFHENIPGEVTYLKDIITSMNNLYGSIGSPSDPITGIVDRQDTRIRFDIGSIGQERIYYYKDTYLNKCNDAGFLLQKIKNTNASRLDNLNICFNQSTYYERIKNVVINNGGSGYNRSVYFAYTQTGGGSGAIAYARVNSSGVIDAVAIKDGGQGYASTTQATAYGITGSGAVFQCYVSNGKITQIYVTNGGSGYPVTPTITLNNGTGASVTCYVTNGQITSTVINNGGSGYLCPPKIVPVGGIGVTPAKLTSTITNGVLTGVTILSGGSGYNGSTVNTTVKPGTATIIPYVDYTNKIVDAAVSGASDLMCAPNLTVTGGGGSGGALSVTIGDNIAGQASGANVNFDSWIKMFASYDSANYANLLGVQANTLNHEMAHDLDLQHLYGGETCTQTDMNYLNDAFLVGTPTACPHLIPPWGFDPSSVPAHTDRYTNNIMGSSVVQVYFSPKQIGKMHRSLFLKTPRKYVKDCPYDTDDPIYVFGNKTWNFDLKVYSDIVIRNGATLTLTCVLRMPDNSKIVVERGGKLIVDGGTITSSCGGMWRGINVEGNYYASQYTTGAQGWVEIKNGAIIENAKDAIRTLRDNGSVDFNYTGGIVQCTGSTFRNCGRRCAEFLTFHNPSDISNRSYFIDCIFETTAPLKDPTVLPQAFISMWDVKGVQFRGNTFRCLPASGYTGTQRGKGIVSLDALYNINQNTGGTGNSFTNLDIAVEQGSSAPVSLGVNYISGNTFNDNRHGVYISGTGNPPYIDNNIFTRPSPAVSSPASYGVYTTNAKGITVGCNTFSYLSYGTTVLSSGTTSDPASIVIDNDYIENFRGVQTQNTNTNIKISFNDFYKSSATQAHWYNLGNINAQGVCTSATTPAGNRFFGDPPPTYKDIYTSTSYPFTYFHHQGSGSVPLDVVKPVIYQSVTTIQCSYNWVAPTFCNSGGGGSLMAGGGGGEFSMAESFESLYGEEAALAEINDYIYTTGLDTNPELVVSYLEELDNEQADWMLVPYYLQLENYEAANNILEELEADNINEATQLNYYHTVTDAGLQGRNLSQLDSAEVAALDIIAESNSDVRDNARSVLTFFYGRTYPIEEIITTDIPLVLSEPLVEEELVIPNIITPNGDGSNDVFAIGNLPEHSSLTIYSSNGTQVYHSDNYSNNWPPTTIPAGRYYYTLTLPDGSQQNSYFDVVY